MKQYYVYIYFDIRKTIKKNYCSDFSFIYEPFYIGKGCNNRAFSHLKEAYNFKDKKLFGYNKEKCNLIREIKHETKNNPLIEIIKYFDNEVDAYLYEKNLIKIVGRKHLCEGPLLNKTIEWSSISASHEAKIRKGVSNGMYGRKGKLSPVYGKSVYKCWIETYGEEVAKAKEAERRKKLSIIGKQHIEKYGHPLLGKKHKESTKLKLSNSIKERGGHFGDKNPRYAPLTDKQYYIIITEFLKGASINSISKAANLKSRKKINTFLFSFNLFR